MTFVGGGMEWRWIRLRVLLAGERLIAPAHGSDTAPLWRCSRREIIIP